MSKMKVYVLTEESRHAEHNNLLGDCKRVIGVYECMLDAQEAMIRNALKVKVKPGIDNINRGKYYVETVVNTLVLITDFNGRKMYSPKQVRVWLWEINEFEVVERKKVAE